MSSIEHPPSKKLLRLFAELQRQPHKRGLRKKFIKELHKIQTETIFMFSKNYNPKIFSFLTDVVKILQPTRWNEHFALERIIGLITHNSSSSFFGRFLSEETLSQSEIVLNLIKHGFFEAVFAKAIQAYTGKPYAQHYGGPYHWLVNLEEVVYIIKESKRLKHRLREVNGYKKYMQ